MRCEIIYEDEEILIVHKPAGLATQSAKLAESDVVSELKNYLAAEKRTTNPVPGVHLAAKKRAGAPYLGVVHRLDQPVEGLLAFAKTKNAAAALTRQLGSGTLNKKYLAATFGEPNDPQAELCDMLRKDGNVTQVVTEKMDGNGAFADAKPAKLKFQRLDAKSLLPGTALLEVEIETGRFHQIRAQLSHAGIPILGDRKYGSEASKAFSTQNGVRNLALCACELTLIHPKTKKKLSWNCKPSWLPTFFET
ncbi:MAG: RluA family pseudouridine synthase [Lachnospiraceae bacterium]|nr:RluA family pseudouridine synthase [Lachnospiraceae bacterium]